MRLLLTRPLDDSRRLAEILEAHGHRSLIEPLLTIEPLDPALSLEGVQALALTSRHGLAFLPSQPEATLARLRALPLFAVGGATAETALSTGFTEVFDADGDAAGLARVIAARLDPAAGAILHLAGEEASPALGEGLARAGFTLRGVTTYRAVPATTLSSRCCEALAENRLDAAIFLSPKTAHSFVRLVGDAGLAEACGRLVAFCLSPAVARALAPVAWRRISVAEEPRLDDLLAAIDASPTDAVGQRREPKSQ